MGERGSLVLGLCGVEAMDDWRLKKEVRVCFSREEKEGVKQKKSPSPMGL
jgi:hypothetical protein